MRMVTEASGCAAGLGRNGLSGHNDGLPN